MCTPKRVTRADSLHSMSWFDLVAAQVIVPSHRNRGQLLLCAGDAADGQRAFRVEEIAVGPAPLQPDTLASAITKLTGKCAHRPRLKVDSDIDHPADADRRIYDKAADRLGRAFELALQGVVHEHQRLSQIIKKIAQ